LPVLSALAIAIPDGGGTADTCLQTVRSGPASFQPYRCLGRPGIPEHPDEVRAALSEVLRAKPNDPYARLYLALMDIYTQHRVARTEFADPLSAIERAGVPEDIVVARLALLEWICIDHEECHRSAPLLEQAERLAATTGDLDLQRLTHLAALRWSAETHNRSRALRAEADLGPVAKGLPPWLALLEVTSRAMVAGLMGDDLRIRDLYAQLLSVSPPGSVAHADASAGIAQATANLAWQGLASRDSAERLLRAALDEQRRGPLRPYNWDSLGTGPLEDTLALLLGRSEDTLRLIDDGRREPVSIEFLLQGAEADRSRALAYARELTDGAGLRPTSWIIARAHAEFWAGSSATAIRFGQRALRAMDAYREEESAEELRMNGDRYLALGYQTYISDLLDTHPGEPEYIEMALGVSERFRARILLEKVVRQHGLMRRTPAVPRLVDVQSSLQPDQALVSYLVWSPVPRTFWPYTRGHSWAIVITRDRISAVRIAQGEALQPAVRAWTQLLDSRVKGIEGGSRQLYRDILQPVLAVLPPEVRSLVIVPDGPLHRIPFDALSESGGPPYVAQRYAVGIAPSVAIWLHLRLRPRSDPGVALAFAATSEGRVLDAAETRGEIRPGQLAPLSHARDEAEEAVKAFPAGSLLFSGTAATVGQLTPSALKRVSLVHFAVHGVMDPKEPDQSFLLLAPSSSDPGVLRLADIPRFDWSGKTVVLSACETSTGAFRIGEGVLSLARGFFAGGATTVIGTLSRVRDDDQYTFFKHFYRELASGVPVQDAVTMAKRALIEAGAPPAAWANVVLLGDGAVRPRGLLAPRHAASWRPGLAVTLFLTVVGLALVALRRRRRPLA